MKIKHSKFRNTGLIFELLVKQIAADTLNGKDSAAVTILKNFYSNKSSLAKEYKLYEFIVKNKNVSQSKAEAIVSTITEVSRKLDQKTLKAQKYELISAIKESYDVNEFFGMQVRDYKPLAALYCLLEAQNNDNLINPQVLIDNKTTILEHLTSAPQNEEEEKNILKEFITSVNSQSRLRTLVNEEMNKIASAVRNLSAKVKHEVVKIKLDEVAKSINPLTKKDKISDNHLVNLMQYYDLVNELKSL